MAVTTIEIKDLEGKEIFGQPYKNLYILNENSEGQLIINETYSIDISEIDILEDVSIKKIKWKLSKLGILKLFLSGSPSEGSYLKLKKMKVATETEIDYRAGGLTPITTKASSTTATTTYVNTTNKNAYLFDCWSGISTTSGNGYGKVELYDDTDTLQATIFYSRLKFSTGATDTVAPYSEKHYNPPITIPPGWYVVITSSGSSATVFTTITILEEVGT